MTTPRGVLLLAFDLIALAIVVQYAGWGAGRHTTSQDISFSQLLTDVDGGRVRDVLIQEREIHGTYTNGRMFQTYAPSDPTLVQRLYNKGVTITARPLSDNVPWFVSLWIEWLPFIAVIGVLILVSREIREMQVALRSIAYAIEQATPKS